MGYLIHELKASTIEAALVRSSEVGVLEGSHRKEAANFVGSIGEIVFKACMKQHNVDVENLTDRTDMDYRLQGRFTVDVKTKDRTVFPKADYDNSIPLYNHEHQRPDYFFFISLVRDKKADVNDPYRFTHACLVGGIDQAGLEQQGTVWKKDQVDPRNGTKFWTDCINVAMTDLISTKDFVSLLKEG